MSVGAGAGKSNCAAEKTYSMPGIRFMLPLLLLQDWKLLHGNVCSKLLGFLLTEAWHGLFHECQWHLCLREHCTEEHPYHRKQRSMSMSERHLPDCRRAGLLQRSHAQAQCHPRSRRPAEISTVAQRRKRHRMAGRR